MPLFLKSDSPAYALLKREGCDVHPFDAVEKPDAELLFINQMPSKVQVKTDAQWGRLLANVSSRRAIRITDAVPDGYFGRAKKIRPAFSEVIDRHDYDGLLCTGANLERKRPEDITTWKSLQKIIDRSQDMHGAYFICWAAQVALERLYGIERQLTTEKLFGVYAQELAKPQLESPDLWSSGFSSVLADNLLCIPTLEMPVSRHCYVERKELLRKAPQIDIILDSRKTHPGLLYDGEKHNIFAFNHPEYDGDTLLEEHRRNLKTDENSKPAENYDPHCMPDTPPWRDAGQKAINFWIRRIVQNKYGHLL